MVPLLLSRIGTDPTKALITGTSSGIARTIVKAFASTGTAVALVARREAELLWLVDQITSLWMKGKGIPVVTIVLGPVGDPEIVVQGEQSLGPINVLVSPRCMPHRV